MKKWMTALAAVGMTVAIGLVVRQILQDLSDSADLWKSVTDEPVED